jgi:transcriptional regulator of acetoin/glycerol metabolism
VVSALDRAAALARFLAEPRRADDGYPLLEAALQIDAQDSPESFSDEMDRIEKKRMEDALRLHSGSKTLAARALRMKRTTFYAKMKRYGMS